MPINLDQFNSADNPTPAHQPGSRGPFYFFLASAAIAFAVAIIVIFMMFINQGRNVVETPQKPVALEQSEKTQPNTPPAEDPQAPPPIDGSSLDDVISTSTCSDPQSDTLPFFDYVLATDSQQQWNAKTQKVFTDALAKLDEHCAANKTYLLAVQQALVNPQAPPQINALVKDATWITRVRPAPDDAQIPTGRFTTGLRNIHCSMESDGTSCTINNYQWAAPEGCSGKPATLRIDPSMDEPKGGCLTAIVGETEYPYGTTLANNGYACTVESTGVTCWSEFTGHGFELSRERLNQF
ncbi:hypothetical protein JTE88_00650 [Arcanobacterium phocisimile]|uniref:Ig-like domain-containing protein n=1 Tax=Arcanobacterium phocisimile TaxID=1302235 RepID=A0ABX7IHL3_9ACTO|nr:hypothetical protein [Arcanobacterium phocisimile]QRV02307.1 hypothetical protein JTE88_00650 [Arcanobacterium phocisimile]